MHSRYERRPADLPSLGSRVRVGLSVRRFYCRPGCDRRTFAERSPELVASRARRTLRLAEVQGRTGAALGGEAGARLLSWLAMPASVDTVLRLLARRPLPHETEPRVIGVDDWAKRKGHSYGTIVVDLERHRVVDFLPDRSSRPCAPASQRSTTWRTLANRCHRSATWTAAGAPVAMALAYSVERSRATTSTPGRRRSQPAKVAAGRLPPIQGEVGAPPAGRTGPFPRSASDARRRSDNRARRLALYDEVRRRHAAGEPLLSIARAMNLARGTVRNYAHASSFPERAARRAGRSVIDPHLPHLQARVAEGCEDAAALWRELRARGFAGTAKQVRRWLGERRRKPAKTAPHRWRGRASADPGPPGDGPTPSLPAPRQLAWLLVQPVATLPPADAAAVARVEQDGDAAAVARLARGFTALVRGCDAGSRADAVAARAELDAWLIEAGACGVPAMETFAAGLERDGDAVRAALTTPWRNGQTEGQVNRLKLLKRQSYGRAGFDLLRRRVLLAA